jgi:hypothetical protein
MKLNKNVIFEKQILPEEKIKLENIVKQIIEY